ncbi:MAG: hypothetical protein MZW92_35350 [Comamonadaceae bacterium]|nr:hypothetical protein [Comamonadaceae bacterium]
MRGAHARRLRLRSAAGADRAAPAAERAASRLLHVGATGARRPPLRRPAGAAARPATCWCSTTRA